MVRLNHELDFSDQRSLFRTSFIFLTLWWHPNFLQKHFFLVLLNKDWHMWLNNELMAIILGDSLDFVSIVMTSTAEKNSTFCLLLILYEIWQAGTIFDLTGHFFVHKKTPVLFNLSLISLFFKIHKYVRTIELDKSYTRQRHRASQNIISKSLVFTNN